MSNNFKKQTLSNIARRLNLSAQINGLQILLPSLIYVTDDQRVPDPIPDIVTLLPGSGVLFRHYNVKYRKFLAQTVKDLCDRKDLIFILARDYRLACDLDADGLHLPEYMALNPPIGVRLWLQRPDKFLTAAAHSLKVLHACKKIGVDAALVSPVFPTASHVEQTALGNLRFTRMCQQSTLPIYALGGINSSNAARLIKSNAIGIAAISGISDNGKT
ncbi:MAG: thiamine phosphate synthase [Rhodospirillaceae bacterium]|jgi:thiamine-phosphate pyrophosphorylase|nr:thiamine phosphate synthase [Rhodospirillaceae bacterium]